MNIFSPIETMRLMLLPGKKSRDKMAILQMLRDGGDFKLYTGIDFSEEELKKFDGFFAYDFPYAIFRKDDLTEPLGLIGLTRQENGPEEQYERYELDFYIKRAARRNGYCEEALHALCNTAFAGKLARIREKEETEYLILDRIYALTTEENLPAQSLLEKNGFHMPNTGPLLFAVGYTDPVTDELSLIMVKEYVLEKPQTGEDKKVG